MSCFFVLLPLNVKGISICEEDDVELITTEVCNAIIQSVYKPPNKQFLLPPLQQGNKPHVLIGDFNCLNTLWGYSTTGTDCEAVEHCIQYITNIPHSVLTGDVNAHSTLWH